MSGAQSKRNKFYEVNETEMLSLEDEFFKSARTHNVASDINLNEDGSLQNNEHLCHVIDLASLNHVENFWKRLFLSLRKFRTEIIFLEVALVLHDHLFSSFDEDDWNKKWNNAPTQQFLPRSVKEVNTRGDISSSRCFIEIFSEQKYIYTEANETFERFGYVQSEVEGLILMFPVNRIRNICFRIVGQK